MPCPDPVSRILLPLALVVSLAAAPDARGQVHDHPRGETAGELGTVDFPTSCRDAVQEEFDRGVAMLHSFWYEAAEEAFEAIAERDPDCAMAHWGVAMSRFRQLWTEPGEEDLRIGRAALATARAIEPRSARERAYIEALAAFYEAEDRDPPARRRAYERAMEALHRSHPDDPEAAIFHALAILGTAYFSPPDPGYARQRKTGGILEPMLVERPRHPGVAHYMIHSYDFPELAEQGEDAARRYAEIAPSAPHALHMPSHIFTRLGLWEESVESNRVAGAAARADGWYGEELHTLDYRVHAYLQTGRDAEAKRILEDLPEVMEALDSTESNYTAGLYAAAAIPARYAVERRRWDEAADLVAPSGFFPADDRCWTEGPLHFARGMGGARTDELETTTRAIEAIEECGARVKGGVWADRLEVLRGSLVAWLALAEGRNDEAVAAMRAAADLEDRSDKPPITPGSIAPARALLGEMLIELDRPAEALTAFQTSLEEAPNRFRSLYGAAAAARAAGDSETAARYYRQLLEVVGERDASRPELEEAKELVVGP